MYSERDLKVADTYSRKYRAIRDKRDSEIKKFITKWGKSKIDFTDLVVRVSMVSGSFSEEVHIEIRFLDSIAGFTIFYSKEKGLGYSIGSMGGFSVFEEPKVKGMYILFAKLLEHDKELTEFLDEKLFLYNKEEQKLLEEKSKIENIYPNLFEVYFKNDIYKR